MARADIITAMYAKKFSLLDFNWDTMVAPPLLSLLTAYDICNLNEISRSNKLASNPQKKYEMIDNILRPRGFKKLASGTNRVVYKFLEDQRYCLKISLDRVGLKDNPQEFQNQFKLKPYVSKMFEVSPCGTVGLVERVEPITTREEYLHIIDDVFNLLVEKIIGKYVVDDIGTNFFQNIGIRAGFGPVLLDYPYVYDLDGGKLRCNWQDPYTHEYCLGEIDYDDGFNYLICNKCGKQYQARQLGKQIIKKSIVIDKKGETKAMRILLMRGDQVERVIDTEKESSTITRPEKKEEPVKRAKVLNKNNFDKRVQTAKKNEEKRIEAVKEARERREKKVSENIDKALSNIAHSPVEEEKEEEKVTQVDAGDAAEQIDPNYIQNSRFPRNLLTKDDDEEIEIQDKELDEQPQEDIQDQMVESKVEEDDVEEDKPLTKEELDESDWDKPCKVDDVVFEIDEDVTDNY